MVSFLTTIVLSTHIVKYHYKELCLSPEASQILHSSNNGSLKFFWSSILIPHIAIQPYFHTTTPGSALKYPRTVTETAASPATIPPQIHMYTLFWAYGLQHLFMYSVTTFQSPPQ